MSNTKVIIRIVLSSLILVISGIVLGTLGPFIFKYVIDSNMILTPTSKSHDLWKEFPFRVNMDFYFFNWTNPEDIYNKKVKPKFQEVGPYRFTENQIKSNVTWNDNGTVTFRQLKFWYYNDDKGNKKLQDKITTVNPVALATVHVARSWSSLIRQGLSLTLSGLTPSINITRTVGQMLFEGYPDTLIKIANTFPFFAGRELPPWDKFGWFYMRNGSADFEGVFNMGTGQNSTLGRLYGWNYRTHTPYYDSQCSKVDGSAGEFFEPCGDKDTIKIFSSDLCRTLVLKNVGQTEVHGIVGKKYIAEDHMLDNGTIYPENKCFCNGECLPSGVVNVSSCRYGSPSFGSLPHFLNADSYYTNLVEGLKPDKNIHEFSIILEPTTGIPLEVNVRLQINLLLQPVPGIKMYENAPKVFFPMLWFEQNVKLPENEAFKIRMLLYIPIFCISLGILLVLLGLFFFGYKLRAMKRYKKMLIKTETVEETVALNKGNLVIKNKS